MVLNWDQRWLNSHLSLQEETGQCDTNSAFREVYKQTNIETGSGQLNTPAINRCHQKSHSEINGGVGVEIDTNCYTHNTHA